VLQQLLLLLLLLLGYCSLVQQFVPICSWPPA
jgi:hypothetical protein